LLSEKEFCVAMHLIVCLSKKNLQLPPALPQSLVAFLSSNKEMTETNSLTSPTAQPSTQIQQQPLPNYGNPPPLQQPPLPVVPVKDKFSAFDDIDNSTVYSAGHYSVGNFQSPNMHTQAMPVLEEPSFVTGQSMTEDIPKSSVSVMSSHVPPMQTVYTAPKSSASVVSSHAPPMQTVFTNPAPPNLDTMSLKEPSVIVPPVTNPSGMSLAGVEDSQLQSLVTQLKAENVSLKAKLASYKDEEVSIVDEKEKLIAEVAILTERISTLREQCAVKREAISSGNAEVEKLKELKVVQENSVVAEEAQLDWLDQNASIPPAPLPAPVPAPVPVPDTMDLFGSEAVQVSPPVPFDSVQVGPTEPLQETNTSAFSQTVPVVNNEFQPPIAAIAPQPAVTEMGPTEEETLRLNNLREATAKMTEDKNESEANVNELRVKCEEAKAAADLAEMEVNELTNSKSKGFGGKKKKAKELEALKSKAALELQKSYEAAQTLKSAEEVLRTYESNLENAQLELASFESVVQANVQQRKSEASEASQQMFNSSNPVTTNHAPPASTQKSTMTHTRTNTAEISNDMFGLYGGSLMGGGAPSSDKPTSTNNYVENNPFW